jgi:large subunit ribosomal protein L9e
MKSAYAHFPININISDDKANMEIRNFLGEKVVRTIKMPKGIAVRHTNMKDEISITGNSLEDVSQSAAVIQQSTSVKNKDIRKFLDGVYVSSRGVIEVKTK